MLYYVYNNDIDMEYNDVSQTFKGSGGFAEVSFDSGATWVSISSVKIDTSERFRAEFWLRTTNNTTNEHWMGRSYEESSNFPCIPGHLYLAICDVCNAGAAGRSGGFHGPLPSGVLDVSQQTVPLTANQTNYTRVYKTFAYSTDNYTTNGRFYLHTYPSAAGGTILMKVKNWRQFDVTGWTTAQIQTLATKANFDEVYLTLPSTFKGQSNMTEDKFLAMGGIIRNDNVDGEEFFHNVAYNWIDLN